MSDRIDGGDNMPGPYAHSLPVGFPSPALEYLKDPLDLGKVLAPRPLSTFYFFTEGDSMQPVIPEKALLVVDRSLKPKKYDIVVAVLNGEWTVRFILPGEEQYKLVPANAAYAVTEISVDMDCHVWGVVTKVIIEPKMLQHVCINRLQ